MSSRNILFNYLDCSYDIWYVFKKNEYIWCQDPGFESCIQHTKTICLLSIRISLACARALKLTSNMYIARARFESELTVGSSGLNVCWSWGQAVEFKFLAWSSIAQSVCQREFSLWAIWCLRPWVRIMHSADEDNLSPFDSNIACQCQSIGSNNNTHIINWVYRPEPRSSGGNTSSNPRVLAFIPRSA